VAVTRAGEGAVFGEAGTGEVTVAFGVKNGHGVGPPIFEDTTISVPVLICIRMDPAGFGKYRLGLEAGVVGAVPAAVAGPAELTETERSQTGVFVVCGPHFADLDVLKLANGACKGVGFASRFVGIVVGVRHHGILAFPARDRSWISAILLINSGGSLTANLRRGEVDPGPPSKIPGMDLR